MNFETHKLEHVDCLVYLEFYRLIYSKGLNTSLYRKTLPCIVMTFKIPPLVDTRHHGLSPQMIIFIYIYIYVLYYHMQQCTKPQYLKVVLIKKINSFFRLKFIFVYKKFILHTRLKKTGLSMIDFNVFSFFFVILFFTVLWKYYTLKKILFGSNYGLLVYCEINFFLHRIIFRENKFLIQINYVWNKNFNIWGKYNLIDSIKNYLIILNCYTTFWFRISKF